MAARSIRKLKLTSNDRLGIVADIASILTEYFISICAMEVDAPPGAEKVEIYLEVDTTDSLHPWEEVHASLRGIHSLTDFQPVATLPREAREQRLQVVLDSISDGIPAVDDTGSLTIMNRVAEEIVGLDASEGIGRAVKTLGLPETHLQECLNGAYFDRVPRNIQTGNRRYQFLATTRPIQDSSGHIVGAVEVLKDLKRIQELAKAVSQPKKKNLHPYHRFQRRPAPADPAGPADRPDRHGGQPAGGKRYRQRAFCPGDSCGKRALGGVRRH